MTLLFACFILACVGVAMEVAFTALSDARVREGWRLKGQSYVWMFPIYALVAPFFAFMRPLVGTWPWALRAPLYVAVLYGVEYATGWVLRRLTGRCPWDYGDARWAVHGLIRLDYAPAWLAAVSLFEFVALRLL